MSPGGGQAGFEDASYPVRSHAAQSVFGGVFTFAYDADGNMTSSSASGNVSTFGYDAENRLNSRTGAGGNFTYTYDGNGTLVKRTDTGTGAWTVYIGGIYEVTNTAAVTKYYTALGRTIAMRQSGTAYWLLSDHLGSNSVTTDGIGAVVGSVKCGPYGGARSTTGTLVTDKLYTGQQQEAGDPLGLYNYKARFYSTTLGRFLGVDPAGTIGVGGQSNFQYVRNNPLRFTDPTGLSPEAPASSRYRPCGKDLRCALERIATVNDQLELLGITNLDAFWSEVRSADDPSTFIRDVLGNAATLTWMDDLQASIIAAGVTGVLGALAETGATMTEEGIEIFSDEAITVLARE